MRVGAILGLLALGACTTWEEVRLHGGLTANVAPGDRVQITLADGSERSGTVERVAPDALTVAGAVIQEADMRALTVREVSGGRTAGSVAGGVGTFLGGTILAVGIVALVVLL